jgi:hypothetical protein
LEERGIEKANALAALAGLTLLYLKISRGRANLRDFKERKSAGSLRDILHIVRELLSSSMRTYSLQYADMFLDAFEYEHTSEAVCDMHTPEAPA